MKALNGRSAPDASVGLLFGITLRTNTEDLRGRNARFVSEQSVRCSIGSELVRSVRGLAENEEPDVHRRRTPPSVL